MERLTGFEPALGITTHFQLPFSWFVAKGDTDALIWRSRPDLNRDLKDLQSHALPFCYGSILAALRGFEPQLPESEAGVLPLDERAMNWYPIPESNWRSHLERVAS